MRAAAAVLLTLATGTALHAQASSPRSLKPATATLAEEFTRIVSVRELADHRVLIVDAKETRLVVADFAARSAIAVGRTGSGPGEYRMLFELFALGGDTTLVPDPNNRRWLLMNNARMVGASASDDIAVVASFGFPLGADASGHILARVVPRAADGKPSMTDSLRLVLIDRKSGRADTVGRLPSPFAVSAGSEPAAPAGARGAGAKRYAVTMTNADRALLFPDGWLVIARAKPYRVEWRSPTGTRVMGAPLPFVDANPTDGDKRAFLAWTAVSTGWPPTSNPDEVSTWPPTMPPFVDSDRSPLIAVPDGRVAIARLPTATAKDRRYDLVDRSGALIGQLRMPLNEQLVGFGATSAYVSVTDADGIQRLRRHPWP